MGSVLRGLAVYAVLLLMFRLAGKRSLAQITTFDAVLLLIIAEAVQQALIDSDQSMTNAFLLVLTLLGADVFMSVVTVRSPRVDNLLNDAPTVIVEDGKPLERRMRRARVTTDDVLEQARGLRGVERLEQVRYAVLERSGGITVIPYAGAGDRP